MTINPCSKNIFFYIPHKKSDVLRFRGKLEKCPTFARPLLIRYPFFLKIEKSRYSKLLSSKFEKESLFFFLKQCSFIMYYV